jgi:uncharacterized delta-60 repeat protein
MDSQGLNVSGAASPPRKALWLLGLALALAAVLAVRALAAPGDREGAFSGDGIATLGADTRLTGAAAQPDGKLVASGVQGEDAGNERLIVVRFNANGALDSSFSGDGIAVGGANTSGSDVAIDNRGRILVSGRQVGQGQSNNGMLVARLTPGGAFDNSFSGDGVAVAFGGQDAEANSVALDGEKPVIAGSAPLNGFPRLAVARFNANGAPDGSFSGGTVVRDFGRLSVANDIAIAGGKILIAGQQRDNLQTTNVLAARLNSNGAGDGSFGNSGVPGLFVNQYSQGAGYSAAWGIAVDGQGRAILAGAATNGVSPTSGADALAIRLTGAGRPDGSFSGDGVVYLPAATRKDQYTSREPFPGAQSVTLSGSAIVLGGYFDETTLKRPALWALNAGGGPVGNFGQGGRAIVSLGSDRAQLADVTTTRSGQIYGAGDVITGISAPRGLAARFTGLGPPPGGPGGGSARCQGKRATIVGTSGRDVLRGTGRRDVIAGLGGQDRIIARGGNDIVCGNGGNDRIYLHGGNDKASGGAGADLLAGGPGNDVLRGNGGRDRLLGAAGNDRLFGGGGNDVMLGAKGRDFLRGGGGRDRVNGGAGRNNVRQ